MPDHRTSPTSDGPDGREDRPEPKAGPVVTVMVWLAALVVASFLLL